MTWKWSCKRSGRAGVAGVHCPGRAGRDLASPAGRKSAGPGLAATARVGSFRISHGFISSLDLIAIGLLSAEEAEELHAMETSGAAKS